MIEYTWRIDPLMVESNVNGLENVVVKVTWICEAVDGEFKTHTAGFVPLEFDENAQFTPYEELTEELVLQWIAPYIDKSIIEEGLATVIDGHKHPQYKYLPTPWSQV